MNAESKPKDGALEVYADPDVGRAADLEWIEVNRRAGPARWERQTSHLEHLGRNAVLVTTRWAFRRPDGPAVWDFVDTSSLPVRGAVEVPEPDAARLSLTGCDR